MADGLLQDRAACTPGGDVTDWDPEAILTEDPHEVDCQRCVQRDPRAKALVAQEQWFTVEVRDKGDEDWTVMLDRATPRAARTKMVNEAGFMARGGWEVVGYNRAGITVVEPETGKQTEFRMRKVGNG